jgi:hypothetical protein
LNDRCDSNHHAEVACPSSSGAKFIPAMHFQLEWRSRVDDPEAPLFNVLNQEHGILVRPAAG